MRQHIGWIAGTAAAVLVAAGAITYSVAEDGGFLVFGTETRRDSYSVQANSYIDWDDRADTAAYLPGRVYRSAVLDYTHQLLLYAPPEGQGLPRLIGQYGGVVDGQGS